MGRAAPTSRFRYAFTLIEILIVIAIMGVMFGLALPKLNVGQYRADAAAQQVRAVFRIAQRTSLTRQCDVIVTIDTARGRLRIAADTNNNGTLESPETRNATWRAIGIENQFAVPPRGVEVTTVSKPLVGSQLRLVDAMPSVVFHRDGSTSTEAELYLRSTNKGRTDFRAITLARATGRSALFRLAGTGTQASWQGVP